MWNRRPDTADYTLLVDSQEQRARYDGRKRRRIVGGVAGLLVLLVVVVAVLYWAGRQVKEDDSGGDRYTYRHAAVASDVALCSTVGKDLLEAGGNAVDSAIGTLLCLGLADPQSMGIGGGFVMTIYNRSTQTSMSVIARETAPLAANETMFNGQPEASSIGPLSIAVPGEIRGYRMAHQQFGYLPWSELFTPAIKMAESGFAVPESMAKAFEQSKDSILAEPSLSSIYTNPATGKLYKTGEIITLPRLAEVLKAVQSGGDNAFYSGILTDDIMADLRDIGAIITKEDLQQYRALVKEAVNVTLNDGLRVFAPPPPSSGALLEFMLNVLDGYNMTSEDLKNTENSVRTMHRIVETFKFAYAKRTDLADEDFDDNVAGLVKNLTSRAYADSIRAQITDNSTHNVSYYGPTFYDRYTTSTSHLSVVDQQGNAVSVTSTVNARFGSKRRGNRTGIVFNNEMDDFSSPNITNIFGIPPSPANFIKPGKRPLSSMCPAIMVTPLGDVRLVVGAAGGSRITTATAFVSALELWLGRNVAQAVSALRLHHQLLPMELQYEEGFDQAILDGLTKLGHQVESVNVGKSIVQAISRHGSSLNAVSDYRKGGKPDGY